MDGDCPTCGRYMEDGLCSCLNGEIMVPLTRNELLHSIVKLMPKDRAPIINALEEANEESEALLAQRDAAVEALVKCEKAIVHIMDEHPVARAHRDLCDALITAQRAIAAAEGGE